MKIWRFEKQIALSERKPPLVTRVRTRDYTLAFLPHDTPTAIAMSNSYQTPDRVTTQNPLFFARDFDVLTHHVTSLKQLDSTGVVIDASGKIIAFIFTGNSKIC